MQSNQSIQLTEANAAQSEEVTRLYTVAKVWASGNKITPASVVDFTLILIRSIQKIVKESKDPNGKGAFKKSAVLTVLNLVIKEAPLKDEERSLIMNIIQMVVPNMIDAAVGLMLY